jgi:hypothetical protein
VQHLIRRYEAEEEAAYQPRSKRPHANARAVPADLEDRVLRLRKELSKQGWNAGAETIRTRLQRDPNLGRVPSTSTIWRILVRRAGSSDRTSLPLPMTIKLPPGCPRSAATSAGTSPVRSTELGQGSSAPGSEEATCFLVLISPSLKGPPT